MNRNQTFPVDIGWRALLKDMGVSVARVLRRAGLPADILSRVGEGLGTEDYFRFWRALEDEAADPLFPLRMVQSVTAEVFSPPIFAALCSANLMQAVQRLAKYKQLVAPMGLDVEVRKSGDLTLSPRWLSAQTNTPTSLQAAEIAFFLRLAQLATREPVKALRVKLPELPPTAYQAYLSRCKPLAICSWMAVSPRSFRSTRHAHWEPTSSSPSTSIAAVLDIGQALPCRCGCASPKRRAVCCLARKQNRRMS